MILHALSMLFQTLFRCHILRLKHRWWTHFLSFPFDVKDKNASILGKTWNPKVTCDTKESLQVWGWGKLMLNRSATFWQCVCMPMKKWCDLITDQLVLFLTSFNGSERNSHRQRENRQYYAGWGTAEGEDTKCQQRLMNETVLTLLELLPVSWHQNQIFVSSAKRWNKDILALGYTLFSNFILLKMIGYCKWSQFLQITCHHHTWQC